MPRDTRMDASKGDFYNEKTGQKIELLAAAKNPPAHLKEYVQEPKPAGVAAAERDVPNAAERAFIDRVKAKATEKKGGKSRRRHKKRRGTRRHRRR